MQSDWNYLKKTIQDVPNITSNLNQEVVKGEESTREMTQHFNLLFQKKGTGCMKIESRQIVSQADIKKCSNEDICL